MPTDAPYKLGPFVGGLNSFSDPTAIDDVELAECINFDMYPDGSLVNRPPFLNTGVNFPSPTAMKVLGWYVSAAGAAYLIASDGASGTYYYAGSNWVTLTATISASAMVQYNDKAWLVAPPGSANPGGSWDPSSGWSAVATMPKGGTIAVQKERLWVGAGGPVSANGSRVYFCDIADPTTWNGDFITVNNGDGQNVLEIRTYYQDLLIFKDDSTYRFSYDIDPAGGTISRVSETVGCNGPGCVTTFENRVFVLHSSHLYELTNYNYERLNDKVPFVASNESTSLTYVYGLSYFSNRIFVNFYDKLYVWSVRTRTWAVWESALDGLDYVSRLFPVPGEQDINSKAYLHSRTLLSSKLYTIVDSIGTNAEDMVCSIITKNYDYQAAGTFKRIFMWGADCVTRRTITGTITPVQFSQTVTWGTVKTYTWGQIKGSPWGRLLGSVTERVDTVPISSVTGERKFIKLGDKSLRFRQVGFKIEIETDGSSAQAPVILYNLQTWVRYKQSVVKRVS